MSERNNNNPATPAPSNKKPLLTVYSDNTDLIVGRHVHLTTADMINIADAVRNQALGAVLEPDDPIHQESQKEPPTVLQRAQAQPWPVVEPGDGEL